MSYFEMCLYCELDTAGNHKPGCPNSNVKIIDGASISVDLSGVTNQAVLKAEALQHENEQLKAEAARMREALLELNRVSCNYCGCGNGNHAYNCKLMQALYDTPTDDHDPADEFGPVDLNSVKPDKLVIPHNPADVEALKQGEIK